MRLSVSTGWQFWVFVWSSLFWNESVLAQNYTKKFCQETLSFVSMSLQIFPNKFDVRQQDPASVLRNQSTWTTIKALHLQLVFTICKIPLPWVLCYYYQQGIQPSLFFIQVPLNKLLPSVSHLRLTAKWPRLDAAAIAAYVCFNRDWTQLSKRNWDDSAQHPAHTTKADSADPQSASERPRSSSPTGDSAACNTALRPLAYRKLFVWMQPCIYLIL